MASDPFDTEGDVNPALECPICLDAWRRPIAMRPCGHIFCKGCIARCWKCPMCRAEIDGHAPPHPNITAMLHNIKVRCRGCADWVGERRTVARHVKACPALSTWRERHRDDFEALMRDGGLCDEAACTQSYLFARGQSEDVRPAVSTGSVGSHRLGHASTPVTVDHADPRRPWRSYGLTASEYRDCVAAFTAVAAPATASVPHRHVTLGESFARFVNSCGLLAPLAFDKDAVALETLFRGADVNRTGWLSEHLAVGFAALNRTVSKYQHRSFQHRRMNHHSVSAPRVPSGVLAGDGAATAAPYDDEVDEPELDAEEDEDEDEEPGYTQTLAPLPSSGGLAARIAPVSIGGLPEIGDFGGLPDVNGMGGVPSFEPVQIPGMDDLDPHIRGDAMRW